jgi:arylsulfatase A-like enzyme
MKLTNLRFSPALACAAALILYTCAYAAPASTTDRPNVVVILIDDMGFADLGCYGGEVPTPNIDKMADEGVRFTQFYNTARCSTSRAALLTGLYPHQAGMGYLENLVVSGSKGTTGHLSDDCVTMAEVLDAAGYLTIMTGKWHLGEDRGTPPWQRGFARSLSANIGELYFPNQQQKRENGIRLNGKRFELDDPKFGKDWYGPDLITEWGLKFIDEAIAENKPFFYYLPHCATHFPLQVPQEDIERYRGKYKVDWDKLREARHKRQIEMGLVDAKWPLAEHPPGVPDWNSLSDEEKDHFDHIMAIDAAMIDRLDRSVGILIDGLTKRGVLDNTIVMLMCDNGGNAESGPRGRLEGDQPGGPKSVVFLGQSWATVANTPFRRYKHFTHEGGISTPLIVHWPAGIDQARNGKLEPQPGHLVDLMPTVVEVTGATYPKHYKGHAIEPIEGTSLVPAFAGKPLDRQQPIFFAHEGNRAIRDGKWKLVMKFKGAWELYDIEADRTEQHDLITKEPQVAIRLAKEWNAWAERADVDAWEGPVRNDFGNEINRPANQTDGQKLRVPPSGKKAAGS